MEKKPADWKITPQLCLSRQRERMVSVHREGVRNNSPEIRGRFKKVTKTLTAAN